MSAAPVPADRIQDWPWREHLSREELDRFLALDDLRSWGSLAGNWAIVFASFAAVALAPGPLGKVLAGVAATFVIGARQLGFAVLMHEAAHRTLFRDRRLNDWAGNWLCAYPVWGDLFPYRPYHLQHHARNWTREDPDLALALPFPITRRSMARKIWRDLSGQTGWKRARATLRRDLGVSQGKVRRRSEAGLRSLRGVAVTNAALFAILAAAGHPALYLLWPAAWLTSYSLVMRLRSIAEHAMVPEPSHPLRNTRTTLASLWERLLIAPNRVNYHLEHHLLMTVPHYRLPALHELLRERGALDGACVERGYANVLRLAASKRAEAGGEESEEALPGDATLRSVEVRNPPF